MNVCHQPSNSSLPTPHSSLSIIIPSHSRPDLLRLCLTSVVRFAPSGTEIIVVDDGSRGGCVSRAAEAFPGVKVARRPKVGGFCVAANAGIAIAAAPIIELLNDDTEVTAGWADAALAWFADERIAAVAPLVLQNDPQRAARGLPPLIDTAGDEYDLGGFAVKRGRGVEWAGVRSQGSGDRNQGTGFNSSLTPDSCLLTPELTPDSGPLTPELTPEPAPEPWPLTPGRVWGASACAAFYRRDALLHAGGFPEHFGAYFEDVDLSFRLRRHGFEIVYEPRAVVWHRVSGSYGRTPSRRTLERQSCNEERVFWRNVRGRELVKAFPRHAVVLAGKALRRWQEGMLLPWLLGRLRAITAF